MTAFQQKSWQSIYSKLFWVEEHQICPVGDTIWVFKGCLSCHILSIQICSSFRIKAIKGANPSVSYLIQPCSSLHKWWSTCLGQSVFSSWLQPSLRLEWVSKIAAVVFCSFRLLHKPKWVIPEQTYCFPQICRWELLAQVRPVSDSLWTTAATYFSLKEDAKEPSNT